MANTSFTLAKQVSNILEILLEIVVRVGIEYAGSKIFTNQWNSLLSMTRKGSDPVTIQRHSCLVACSLTSERGSRDRSPKYPAVLNLRCPSFSSIKPCFRTCFMRVVAAELMLKVALHVRHFRRVSASLDTVE